MTTSSIGAVGGKLSWNGSSALLWRKDHPCLPPGRGSKAQSLSHPSAHLAEVLAEASIRHHAMPSCPLGSGFLARQDSSASEAVGCSVPSWAGFGALQGFLLNVSTLRERPCGHRWKTPSFF